MEILLVGLNHKTASVDIRERLAFDETSTIDALGQLKERYPAGEFVLLSTCNRVELYCAAEAGKICSAEELARFLSDYHNVAFEAFGEFLYISHNEDCVRHLMTVTSSLDSMVVGEPQITAQVKESYRLACEVGSSGKVLNRLFHCAFSASKDIYTRTSITSRRVSVAGVSVELAKQLFADIVSAKIVVIGAGEMGELLVEHLLGVKCNDITVVNRSSARARKLASRHDIAAEEWTNLDDQLLGANIVVAAATATQGYLFDKSAFRRIMEARRGRTLLVIDIAVPRNFEPAVNEIENIYLYSIDDLAQVVEKNIRLREDDIDEAVEIICEKVSEFMDWLQSKDIGPLIGRIKESFEQIRQNELERFFVGHRRDANCKEVMEVSVGRIVNKLLHCVIRNINIVAKEQGSTEAAKLAGSIVEQAEDIAAGVTDQEKPQK
jgi:glutamyl-tRNA reductase